MKILLMSLLLLGPLYEEDIETEVPTEDPTPVPTAEPTPWIVIEPSQDAETIIQYLEEQKRLDEEKKLQEEEEKKLQEEEEKKLQEEEEIQTALKANGLLAVNNYSSQSNVINGYAQNYRYYWTGAELISSQYTRYNYYIFVFDDWTQFKKVGNMLHFENGKCKLIRVPYEGAVTITEVTEDIAINRGWYNEYSNIDELNYPAIYNISKDSQIGDEKIIQIMVIFTSLWVGYSWLLTIMRGNKNH